MKKQRDIITINIIPIMHQPSIFLVVVYIYDSLEDNYYIYLT